MEAATILARSLGSLLRYFQGERHHLDTLQHNRQKELEDAMLATHHAIAETNKYLEKFRGKELHEMYSCQDRDIEYKLSELWAISAIRSSKFIDATPDYAKAREWLEGIRWETWNMRQERLDSLGISLERMQERLEQTMKDYSIIVGK
ncbi:hypothetical protein [Vibrio campbellii]|uniref:hypothetical protein n=1 Tax=Vibrio campbellii TaxID=680 RepID=UPI0037369872